MWFQASKVLTLCNPFILTSFWEGVGVGVGVGVGCQIE